MSGKNFKRLHLFITGQVQGVFFRAYSQTKARQLGLSGWVRNLPDGRVEMVIEGEPAILRKMLTWCYQGPPRAKVEKIEMVWEKSQGEKEFKIRY